MRNSNTKVRCEKLSLSKCPGVCRTYSDIQLAYAQQLQSDESIDTFRCNVPLQDFELTDQSASKGRVTTDVLISMVCNACVHTSVLIVDELQNVANSRNGASLISSLIQLVNSCPVSTVFVACNEVLPILEQDPKLARRALGIQVGEVSFDADFVGFCETLYRYKYVSGDMVLTDGTVY